MSLVARQSIKYSLVSYFSYFIGTLATLFLYPNDFSFSGEIQLILSYAQTLYPFLTLGLGAVIIAFHQKLKEEKQEKSFFTFSLLLITLVSLFIILLYKVLELIFPVIQKTDFAQLSVYIFPIAFLLSLAQIFSRSSTNFKRIVVPNLLQNILPKLGSIAAFSLFYYGYFTKSISLSIFVLFHFFIIVFLAIYITFLQKNSYSFDFQFLKNKKLFAEIKIYAFFSILGGVGNIVALQIDKVMIGEFLTHEAVGMYSLFLALVSLINIPTLGVYAITSPLIVEYLKKKDIPAIKKIYQKSALYLFFLASLLLCMILAGADSLFKFINNGDKLTIIMPVLYILGFATLFDISTGFNSNILSLSKHYKFNTLTLFGLSFLTIILNLIFIFYFHLGTLGVAIATLISIVIFNTIKCIYIYKIYHFQPFTKEFITIFFMIICSLLAIYFIPDTYCTLFNLILKPSIIGLIFLFFNQLFPIINLKDLLSKNWKKFLDK